MDFKKMIHFKSFEELVQEAIEKMQTEQSKIKTGITNFNIGGRFRTLLELACEGAAELFKLLLILVPMGFLRYANGVWLDLKAEEYGVYRLPAKNTHGKVVFYRETVNGNTAIPAGVLIGTEMTVKGDELRYYTIESAVIPNGETEAEVPVKAETPGEKYNVFAESISKIISSVPGISGVRNASDWITEEGADEESDKSLRERCYLRWDEISKVRGGAFLFWAREVPGVVRAKVNDQHPRGQGTIDIIITGPEGYPSQTLIDSVQTHIENRKYICADPLVKGPQIREIDIITTLYLPPDEGEEEMVKQQAIQLLAAMDFDIGESLYTSDVIHLLRREIEELLHVTVETENAIVSPEEIIQIGTIDVTVERAS